MDQGAADRSEAIATVRKLIEGIGTAMLTTITDEGLVSRPMKTQETEFDGDLWFLTMRDTNKYRELQRRPDVNVVYSGHSYVSIRGTAELVEDRARIKSYWNPMYGQLLETDSDDPDLVLIKVKAETAEYWETGSPVKMVKHLLHRLTGKGPGDQELNETVRMDRV